MLCSDAEGSVCWETGSWDIVCCYLVWHCLFVAAFLCLLSLFKEESDGTGRSALVYAYFAR